MSVHEDSSDTPFDPTSWPSGLQHWIAVKRIAGTRFLDAAVAFIDLEAERTLEALNTIPILKTIAVRYGYNHITSTAVRDAHRELTQALAYALYQVVDERGRPVGGISYSSRFAEDATESSGPEGPGGHEITSWECWALFDRRVASHHSPGPNQRISLSDPDLRWAVGFHRIR